MSVMSTLAGTRHRAGVALALALALLAACATNPVTGEREIIFMSETEEAELGREAAAQVEQQIGLVTDPGLVEYVQTIGARLAAQSPRQSVDYRFFVADMPEPNAFALPGGYIYVSRGLLTLSNSEAELANVIGHEIGHVAARHAAQRHARATGVGLATALGAIVAGVAGGGEAAKAAAQLGQAAGAGLIASYGRDQERQADAIGQRLAAASGWDPAAMAHFLATLKAETELESGDERLPSYLDSHPALGERVEANIARSVSLEVTPAPAIADSREAYYARLEGLLVGVDPSGGIFRDNRFLHPVLDFTLQMPPGWRTANGQNAVLSGPESGDALIRLEGQGPAADPASAARDFARASGLTLQSGDGAVIGGFPAYRAVAGAATRQGTVGLDLTWIQHPTGSYRVSGLAPADRFQRYAPAFRATATSFRALTDAERESITERRLRLAETRSGETLEAFSARVSNAWGPAETGIANGLEPGAPLPAGRVLKVAVEVPFAR